VLLAERLTFVAELTLPEPVRGFRASGVVSQQCLLRTTSAPPGWIAQGRREGRSAIADRSSLPSVSHPFPIRVSHARSVHPRLARDATARAPRREGIRVGILGRGPAIRCPRARVTRRALDACGCGGSWPCDATRSASRRLPFPPAPPASCRTRPSPGADPPRPPRASAPPARAP